MASSSASATPIVAIIAKAPRPGDVKTRLGPPLTPGEAAALQAAFLADTADLVGGLAGARGAFVFTPAGEEASFARLAPSFVRIAQQGHDLGARLEHAFATLLETGVSAVVALGADAPTLPTAFVADALARLADDRADGGGGPVGGEVGEALARAEASAACLARVELARLRRREEGLAFWVNVYNALARHGVVRLDLRRSVWQVWNFFGRVSYRIGGHVFSLDDVEHGSLRGNRRRALPPWPPFRRRDPRRPLAIDPLDPRIHVALNCAAASCPPVGVYRAAAIDAQLDLAARSFVNQEVTLDARGRVSCSRILKWYGRDFGAPAMLANFLWDHLDDGPVKAALAAGASPCRVYRAYSWALLHPPA